jgi:hypothetical protein
MAQRATRRTVLAAAAALVTVGTGLAGTAAQAGPSRGSPAHWRIVLRMSSGLSSFMTTVISPGPANAWALGFAQLSREPSFPISWHWGGRHWSDVGPTVGVKDSGFACAASSSATNVWAFTGQGGHLGNPPGNAAAFRLSIRPSFHWVAQKTLSAGTARYVTGCDVLSPTDVWVFGGETAGLGAGVGTWHHTRSGWARLSTGSLVIFRASVISADDIWAAAADVSTPNPRPVLARWNGTSWTEDSSIGSALPTPTNTIRVSIDAIKALSDRNVWVEAQVSNGFRITGAVIVHWNGSKWSRVKPANPGYYLPNAVSDGHGGWWSVPYPASGVTRYLLHEAGGHWTRFPTPVPLDTYGLSLAHVPHSRAMLAASTYSRAGRATGVVLAFGALPI